jgi:hypothetical protein
VTSVALGDGARTSHDPKGSVTLATDDVWGVYVHPTMADVLILTAEKAVHLFDTSTGNSNILSY